MVCKPCRVTFECKRYQIERNGTVRPTASLGDSRWHGDPVDADLAKQVRAEAQRQRRNRNARERHQAMTDLGLRRVRGNLGGVYYE